MRDWSPGSRLGPYEILSAVGAGGVGQVYKARDTRLDRVVAIKVLHQHRAMNPAWRQRFEREARAISHLNHPHICTLYDIGTSANSSHGDAVDSDNQELDATDFLVLEYLEGQTLSQRLGNGPLPLEQALQHGLEIADALAEAHREGIIHGDLKPSNVMLTRSGAKLLDFGLARLCATNATSPGGFAESAANVSDSLTAEGAIVGTPSYMAPEILVGLGANARSDLFGFGALIYEMVTGSRAFTGETPQSVMVAVLDSDPASMSALQPATPPLLEYAVKRCLAKAPEERWASAHDVALVLRAIAATPGASPERPVRMTRRIWIAATLLGLVSLTAQTALPSRRSTDAGSRLTFVLPSMSGEELRDGAIAPDGRSVAYVAAGAVWIRPLDTLEPRRLVGTEGAYDPFWSPDSRNIGFFSGNLLQRIGVSGGGPSIVATARRARGGTWSENGTIVYAANSGAELYRIAETGGEPVLVRRVDQTEGERAVLWPHFLPGSERFVYLVLSERQDRRGIYASALGSSGTQRINDVVSNPVYASGFLLFAERGSLYAQPFDPESMRLTDVPIAIVQRVNRSGLEDDPRHYFSASRNGSLVYRGPPNINRQLVWLDRQGRELGALGEPGQYVDFSVSRDGTRVAVDRISPETGTFNIWLFDLARNNRSPIMTGSADYRRPVWSPDGKRIAYSSNQDGQLAVYQRWVDTGMDDVLMVGRAVASGWSPDGRTLAVEAFAQQTGSDLLMVSAADLAKAEPSAFLRTSSMEREPQISPDGGWMAYSSSAAGSRQVYVDTIPSLGRPWQISTEFGRQPRWRGDGKELYYIALVGSKYILTAVTVTPDKDRFLVGPQRPLFQIDVEDTSPQYHYDVAPDGNRFLVNRLSDSNSAPITVVVNWPDILAP